MKSSPRPAQPPLPDRQRGPIAWQLAIIILAVLAASAWFLYAEQQVGGQWGFSLDDSWIYATFARNLAMGAGYSFNPGEPIAGATGPLYVLILALLYLIFHDVVWPAKALGIVCLCASSLAIYFTAGRLRPKNRLTPLLAGLLVALSPPLLWGSLSGLEIPVYLLLTCVGVSLYVKEKWAAAILCWSLGVWLRPDGLFLVALGLLARPKLSLRNSIGPLIVAAVLVGSYFVFNYVVARSILPTSVAVKAHFGGDVVGSEWKMLQQWADVWGVSLKAHRLGLEPVLLLPGIVVGSIAVFRRWPALAAYVFLFPFFFALSNATGGQYARYIVYIVPVGVLLGVLGFDVVAHRALGKRGVVAVAVLGTLCLSWQIHSTRKMGIAHGWNVQNINGMQRYTAEVIRVEATDGDTVAVNDVGAMGFFSRCYIVDLVGLVSPRRPFPENLSVYKPKFLAVFPDWFENYATMDWRTRQVVFYDADSIYKYSPFLGVRLERNTISSRNTMYLFERVARNETDVRHVQLVVH